MSKRIFLLLFYQQYRPTWGRQENKFVYSAVGVVINRIIFVSANADSVFDMFCFGAKFSVFVAKNAHIFEI